MWTLFVVFFALPKLFFFILRHRFTRLLPVTTGVLYCSTKTAFCDAGMTVPYVEPISYVTFPAESYTKLPDLSDNLQLVSAGVRCMLGDSHM